MLVLAKGGQSGYTPVGGAPFYGLCWGCLRRSIHHWGCTHAGQHKEGKLGKENPPLCIGIVIIVVCWLWFLLFLLFFLFFFFFLLFFFFFFFFLFVIVCLCLLFWVSTLPASMDQRWQSRARVFRQPHSLEAQNNERHRLWMVQQPRYSHAITTREFWL